MDNTQQQDLEKIYKAVASDLITGMAPGKAVSNLVKQGCPEAFAREFVDKVITDIEEFDKTPQFIKYLKSISAGRMMYGGMWIGIAAVIKLLEMRTYNGSFAFNALALLLVAVGAWQLLYGIMGYAGTVLSRGRGERVEQIYNTRVIASPAYRFLLNASIICAAFFVFCALLAPFISAIGLNVSGWLIKYGVPGSIGVAVITWLGGFAVAAWIRIRFIAVNRARPKKQE